jgi:glucosamine kinase
MTAFTIPSYKIGVDGGGTKTEFILVDAAGAVVARHLAPGCNPSQTGSDKARAVLMEGLQALRAQLPTGRVQTMMLFMAGSPLFWKEVAGSLPEYGTVTTGPDSLPVLELATGGQPGLVLHAGTGSFVAARAPDATVHYAGGLGWKLGDAGSGFDLGRRAIAHALLELQAAVTSSTAGSPQLQKISPLAEALQIHTGFTDYAANSRFFYNDAGANAAIAGFAPKVLHLAEHDCGAAQQVVADSVTDLARLADQVVHRLFPNATGTLPCGVSGRILNSVPAAFALRSLAGKLRWPVSLTFITESPAEGVRRLLAKG